MDRTSATTDNRPADAGRSQQVAAARVLNLGAGKDRSPVGATTIDIVADTTPDIVHDLNKRPWPLESSAFDLVYCKDVIEHLADVIATLEEVHRVATPGAMVVITTPHFSCVNSFTDPTHRHHLGSRSFDYVTGENQWNFYTSVRFRKQRVSIVFHQSWKNKIITRIAARWPDFYERHLAWIFPAWFIYVELVAIK